MKSLHDTLWTFAFVLGASCCSPAQDRDSPVALKDREYQTALKTSIKAYEALLARNVKLQQLGAISEYEVSLGRQTLAMLRYDLALANDDADETREQLRVFAKARESDYRRLAKLQVSGAAPVGFVETASRRLASARYMLALEEQDIDDVVPQLEAIIDVSATELRRAENAAKVGGGSAAEIGLHRGRMAFANYLLANETGNADEALQNLRIAISERESAMQRMEKLVRHRAASMASLAEARHSWLRARANLAIEEDNRTVALDLHKKLVETSRELLRYLKANPQSTTPEQLILAQSTVIDYELRVVQAADAAIPLRSLLRKPLADLDN